MLPETLLYKLEHLPAQPGCYLFKDKKGAVVYVGKAKSLRARVRSYFQESSGDARYFVPLLARTVGDLETLVTASEKEAAILEDSLIKEHQPRYNVKLRDDKSFLCLRIDPSHAWPRVDVCRRPSPDGKRYFGPYHSATAARRTLHLVNKYFQLRTCSDQELASRKRPCLQYQIRRCLAPCVYDVDKQWYDDQVRAVGLFLDGRHDELSSELYERMKSAAKTLEFELAATYRDQLRAVDAIRQEQRVVAVKDVDQDVVALYREGDLVQIAVLFIRSGKVTDTAHFPMRGVGLPDDEVIGAFVAQYYAESGSAVTIPDEVVVPVLPEGAEGAAEWLSERRGKKCEVLHPQRGPRADLLRLAMENAEHAFREQRRSEDDVEERLLQLQKRLRLPTLPRRIECCDISHLGGTDTVGAIVALKDGQPDKKRYRTFHVRTVSAGDDYGAMYEVLARRFRRGRAAKEAKAGADAENEAQAEGTREHIDWDLPDLFVVDGGRGQLNVALAAARDLGLHELPIVGLAKERPIPGWPPARLSPEKKAGTKVEGEDAEETEIPAAPIDDAGSDGASTPSPPAEAASTPSRGAEAASTPSPPAEAAAEESEETAPIDSAKMAGPAETGFSDVPVATPITGESPIQNASSAGEGATLADGGSRSIPEGTTSVSASAGAQSPAGGFRSASGAKRKRGKVAEPRTEPLVDRVYLPGQKNGIPLQPNSAPLFFLARARDEAHRFSNRARERLGKVRRFRSELDEIPGIGPATRRALLKALGSVEAVRKASDETLLAISGVTQRMVRALRSHYPAPRDKAGEPAPSDRRD